MFCDHCRIGRPTITEVLPSTVAALQLVATFLDTLNPSTKQPDQVVVLALEHGSDFTIKQGTKELSCNLYWPESFWGKKKKYCNKGQSGSVRLRFKKVLERWERTASYGFTSDSILN